MEYLNTMEEEMSDMKNKLILVEHEYNKLLTELRAAQDQVRNMHNPETFNNMLRVQSLAFNKLQEYKKIEGTYMNCIILMQQEEIALMREAFEKRFYVE